ncbi:glycosyltransferase 2 family protein [Synechococcus sp. PROS-7-1]|uniref:lysylphosphatidylglycerol synthase domain-containing protein n=1 Tax=Synechococcus sp. PROS-7-1 TaxID=1442556 RepID=UPI001645735D|nr:lysylphosphatidylglycerol synthase domain-containing protein [Synechococcus sp. PROS-7-1]QNI85845.1 glycosyltransferase 2 family protein [Synechococcus sp. PROS-7-1]
MLKLRRLPWSVSLPGGLKLWVTLLTLSFVAWALKGHLAGLRSLTISALGWWWLMLALGLSWLSLVVNAVSWRVLVLWLGHGTGPTPLLPLYLSSNLFKYLPGGIWHFVKRVRALAPSIGTGPALVSVLLEPMVMAVAALLWVPFGGFQGGLALLAPLPALLLLPRWREPLLRRLERQRLRQLNRVQDDSSGVLAEPEQYGSGRDGYPWPPLLAELLFVACRFSGFWACLQVFGLNQVLPITAWLAAFALAWTAGLVVPAAPGGLGVFEAVLLLRLGQSVPEAPLLAVALSYRLVVTLADVLAAGGVWADRALSARWLVAKS